MPYRAWLWSFAVVHAAVMMVDEHRRKSAQERRAQVGAPRLLVISDQQTWGRAGGIMLGVDVRG